MESNSTPPSPEEKQQTGEQAQAGPLEAPPSPPLEEPGGEPAPPVQTPVKRHSILYRFLNWLLGKDSAVGRFMRSALRLIATVVGLLALGLLGGYFLLYQPTLGQLESVQAALKQQEGTITGLQGQLKAGQGQLDAVKAQAQTLNDDLKTAQNRNNLLVVINDIATARMDLALKDGAQTMNALNQAKTDLDVTLPFLTEKNPTAAAEVKSRLDLMTSVLVRDSTLAQSDLDNLYTALLAIQKDLFGK